MDQPFGPLDAQIRLMGLHRRNCHALKDEIFQGLQQTEGG
jgi:hypothetical protein